MTKINRNNLIHKNIGSPIEKNNTDCTDLPGGIKWLFRNSPQVKKECQSGNEDLYCSKFQYHGS
jgi:hypothetical protein